MRILAISNCPLDPTLGSGRTRLRWSEGLRALGHEVDIFEPRDFELWHGLRRAIRFRQAAGALPFMQSQLRKRRYDLVEFFGGEFGLATKQLAQQKVRPLIVAHTDGFELLASERELVFAPFPSTALGRLRAFYRQQTHERLSRAAFANADAFVTGCELDRNRVLELRMFPPERTAVIAPGIDADFFAAISPYREPRVAFAGSWIVRKGIRQLIEVMNPVLAETPRLRLDLLGTGRGEELRGEFSAAVRGQIGVYGRISSKEMSDALSKAGVFFFPSQYEGFGMALAEAMARGCAPVTTPTGFGAELRSGEEGIVCAFNDTAAMRRGVRSLLDDDHLRLRIGTAAARRVQQLTWADQVKKLEAVYEGWLGSVGKGRTGRVRV